MLTATPKIKKVKATSSSAAPRSGRELFQEATKYLPKILPAEAFFGNASLSDFLALESSQLMPSNVEYCVLPNGVSRLDKKTTKDLTFLDKKIPEDVRHQLLVKCYAQARGYRTIVRAKDEFLAIPAYESNEDYYFDNVRTVKLSVAEGFDTLLSNVKTLVVQAEVAISASALKTISRSVLALTTLKADQIPEISEAVDAIAELDINQDSFEIPELMASLLKFPKTASLLTILTSFRLSVFGLEEFTEHLQRFQFDSRTQIQALSLHPGMLLPLIGSRKHTLFAADGSGAAVVPISEVLDDDRVLCTKSYITQSAFGTLHNDALVYREVVYPSTGKRGGKVILAEEPVGCDFISGSMVRYFANLTRPALPAEERKRKIESETAASVETGDYSF